MLPLNLDEQHRGCGDTEGKKYVIIRLIKQIAYLDTNIQK